MVTLRGGTQRLEGDPMYTAHALFDIHERAHRNLAQLLQHCVPFDAGDLDRKLDGFGYPSVRLQIHHVIGAEEYWVGVLHGRVEADDNDASYPTIATLESYRARVAEATGEYLRGASADELNTARPMMTWGHREQVLAPARVILRVVTHLYHHQGQVSAMCRLLGHPVEGINFPIG